MRASERAVELLRPLVETKVWDYCVVWKLGDDPSRFIEWMGCCCGGGNGDCKNVKQESNEEKCLIPICRDAHIRHPVRTKACELLAKFPSSMPLYSGYYSLESSGTQVLIPVVGGIIELFSVKHVPRDQRIKDFIVAQCNIFVEHESKTVQGTTNLRLNYRPHDQTMDDYLDDCPASLHDLNLTPQLHFLPPVLQLGTYHSFEVSSSGSNPSNEHPSLRSGSGQVSQNVSPTQSIGTSPESRNPNCNILKFSSTKQRTRSVLGRANSAIEKANLKARQGTENEQYQSKNLITERNRRTRIKDGLFALRALVPKISKVYMMDRVAILGDAIDYIEELQKKKKELQSVLRGMSEEDCKQENADLESPELKGACEDTKTSLATGHKKVPSCTDEKKRVEVQVEVSQIGTRDFLVKYICSKRQGGFVRLLEALNTLGLQVIDVSVTTFDGTVLNILKLE
ncbi:hypothetical protein RJ639_000320, partial [Escallonia herrerae]